MLQKLAVITGANEQQVSEGNRWLVLGSVQIMEGEGQIKKGKKESQVLLTHKIPTPKHCHTPLKNHTSTTEQARPRADIQSLRSWPFPFSSWVKYQSGLLPPFGINVWSLIRGLQQILENLSECYHYPPKERMNKWFTILSRAQS